MSELQFTFVANACGIFTGRAGTRLLCDPWLLDGVFDGSWCHYPPLHTTVEDVRDVDLVFLSHIHPDHFDERCFDFDPATPILVLDHGPNFLPRRLEALGYHNLVTVRDGETIDWKELRLTLFAPFAKHAFHEAEVGNLIDSALLVECGGVRALNANDNTPTVESARRLASEHGPIDLAMLNYNAAGPYPSCFDNLGEDEKTAEHARILDQNVRHLVAIGEVLQPRFLLPFAGAYVLGGDQRHKNRYLGTTTWDRCASWLRSHDLGSTEVVLLREGDTLDVATGAADRPYRPLDEAEMTAYVDEHLATVRYPYQLDAVPDAARLAADLAAAANAMQARWRRFGLRSSWSVVIELFGRQYQVHPEPVDLGPLDRFEVADRVAPAPSLHCRLDERLLRRILDRRSHWNNAEIGAHIDFVRAPNRYEPDLHSGLQFLHL